MKRSIAVGALLLTPVAALATDHFWLIGGGPSPRSGEAQIEFNVSWVRESLRRMAPDAVIHVFFANGADEAPSTVEHLPSPTTEAAPYEALARVFGDYGANRLVYRPTALTDVEGPTSADRLVPELERQLAALAPGDQGMIVYNGHGSWHPDRSRNALRLWGESSLDVRDFERLLGAVHPDVPIRFVFTQCYSGAFERAVHPEARATLELAPGTRCGFFAESEDRLSEGCSASIEIGDYRDYTTYFFAALTGSTRLGQPVTDREDFDGDGVISPFDAHLYTIVRGRNADLPRSTSEVFLERWQPWYLRWTGTDRLPDNLYGRAARELARAADLPEDGGRLGAALDDRFNALVRQIDDLVAEQDDGRQRAEELRRTIREDAGLRWPSLEHPFTGAQAGTVGRELDAIAAYLAEHVRYGELVELQRRDDEMTVRLVELERDLSHLEKLRRTRMLARALDQIERRGSATDRDAYARLRACEALPIASRP